MTRKITEITKNKPIIERSAVEKNFIPLRQVNTPWNTDHTFGKGIAPFYNQFIKAMFLLLGQNESRLRRHALKESLEQTGGITNISLAVDIGCGTGEFTKALAFILQKKSCKIYGIDISEHMIWMANNNHHQKKTKEMTKVKIVFKKADARKTFFQTNSVDLIVSSLGFHEFSPLLLYDVLNEAHRILKPKGRLVIFDYGDAVTKKKTILNTLAYYVIMQIETWKTQYFIRCGRENLFTRFAPFKMIYNKYYNGGIFQTSVFQPLK